MDVEACVARHPELALVDELAHTNIPGSANEKRWQDVVALLNAGINVITTINIQHLESVNDVVEQITGVPQRETVPDAVVRAADQIELVDMTAEALRRRLAHGNVYAPDKVDAALANYFRVGNLTALRELALLWLADRVEEGLAALPRAARHRHLGDARARGRRADRWPRGRAADPPGRPDRGPGRAPTCSRCTSPVPTACPAAPRPHLAEQQALVESLGGRYHVSSATTCPRRCCSSPGPRTRPSSWSAPAGGRGCSGCSAGSAPRPPSSTAPAPIDVHIVTHGTARGPAAGPAPRAHPAPAAARPGSGRGCCSRWSPPVLADAAAEPDPRVDRPGLPAARRRRRPAGGLLAGAGRQRSSASVALNYWFIPPLHTFTIADRNNALALVVFVAVAVAVSRVVDLAATRTEQAARSAAEAEVLSGLAVDGADRRPSRWRRSRRRPVWCSGRRRSRCRSTGRLGRQPATRPAEGHRTVEPAAEAAGGWSSARRCPGRTSGCSGLRQRRLGAPDPAAAAARPRGAYSGGRRPDPYGTARGSRHDLRTPLATIKASTSGAARPRAAGGRRHELLTGIESRPTASAGLTPDLLDLGGLSAVQPQLAAVRVRRPGASSNPRVDVDLPDDLPSYGPMLPCSSGCYGSPWRMLSTGPSG